MRETIGLTALVVGGAECVFRDIEQALTFFEPDMVCAANDVGVEWKGELHHWCSMHPGKLKRWAAARASKGLPQAESYWTGEHREKEATVPVKTIPSLGGGSGLLAIRVARFNGATKIVLAGVPMSKVAHFHNKQPWKEASVYHRFWLEEWRAGKLACVRSMSGWTREICKPPDAEWLAT